MLCSKLDITIMNRLQTFNQACLKAWGEFKCKIYAVGSKRTFKTKIVLFKQYLFFSNLQTTKMTILMYHAVALQNIGFINIRI